MDWVHKGRDAATKNPEDYSQEWINNTYSTTGLKASKSIDKDAIE